MITSHSILLAYHYFNRPRLAHHIVISIGQGWPIISLCQANARSHVVMLTRTTILATYGQADYGRSYSINYLALPIRPQASVGRERSGHLRPGRLWACGFDQKLPTGHMRPGDYGRVHSIKIGHRWPSRELRPRVADIREQGATRPRVARRPRAMTAPAPAMGHSIQEIT